MTERAKQPVSMSAFMAGLARVFKAIPSDKLDDIEDVIDLWNEPGGEHKNPSRAEIVTGPAERMSGDGAPKMIAEYSQPAPQQGLTAQYQEFQRMLDGWAKSFTDKLNPILSRHDTALKGILDVFAEAKKAHETVPAAPGADTFVGKALARIAKAKAAMRKADMADEDEKEERKSHIAAASDLLKSAKRLLAKASEDMEDTDDDAAEKAMDALAALSKAVAKAEKEDKEADEAEKVKSLAAQKAIDDAAALKKAEDEKAEKEKEEAAEKARLAGETAKAAVTQEQILEALKGLTVLPTTVQGLMDAVLGKSVNPVAPEISKGTVVTDIDFAARVDEAIDAGRLSEDGEMRAQSMVQHAGLVKAGRLDAKVFEEEVAKAPAEVRVLFQAAA